MNLLAERGANFLQVHKENTSSGEQPLHMLAKRTSRTSASEGVVGDSDFVYESDDSTPPFDRPHYLATGDVRTAMASP